MSIITISRGSYSKGKEIAEKLSEKLGYPCVNRDVIIEASEEYNIPEVKLDNALHNSPSFFERFTYGKEKYISYIEEAFLHQVQKDNVIYHGLAGHFFLKNISGVLKVRIIANMDDRIKELTRRESISDSEAVYNIHRIDENRRKWSQYMYGIDTNDPSLYDLVLHIDKLNVDQAVQTICDVVGYPCFQSTEESRKELDNLYLAAKAKAQLTKFFPSVKVNCHDDKLVVSCKSLLNNEDNCRQQIEEILAGISINRPIDFVADHVIAPD